MSVRIQLMSDLHLETPRLNPFYNEISIQPQCPYLALLGDIGNVHDDRLFAFITEQLNQFRIVFYVLGNHEPYRPDGSVAKHTLEKARTIMRRFEASLISQRHLFPDSVAEATAQRHRGTATGQFVFLHQRRFDINDSVTILGATLFSHITKAQRATTSLFISDFSNVDDWKVDDHNAAHAADLSWLNGEVERIEREAPHRSVLILTHHSPTISVQANDEDHLEDSRGVQSAFATDLSREKCWASECVKIWAFGHTHFNCDYVETSPRKQIVANQRGYGREDIFNFDPDKVLSI